MLYDDRDKKKVVIDYRANNQRVDYRVASAPDLDKEAGFMDYVGDKWDRVKDFLTIKRKPPKDELETIEEGLPVETTSEDETKEIESETAIVHGLFNSNIDEKYWTSWNSELSFIETYKAYEIMLRERDNYSSIFGMLSNIETQILKSEQLKKDTLIQSIIKNIVYYMFVCEEGSPVQVIKDILEFINNKRLTRYKSFLGEVEEIVVLLNGLRASLSKFPWDSATEEKRKAEEEEKKIEEIIKPKIQEMIEEIQHIKDVGESAYIYDIMDSADYNIDELNKKLEEIKASKKLNSTNKAENEKTKGKHYEQYKKLYTIYETYYRLMQYYLSEAIKILSKREDRRDSEDKPEPTGTPSPTDESAEGTESGSPEESGGGSTGGSEADDGSDDETTPVKNLREAENTNSKNAIKAWSETLEKIKTSAKKKKIVEAIDKLKEVDVKFTEKFNTLNKSKVPSKRRFKDSSDALNTIFQTFEKYNELLITTEADAFNRLLVEFISTINIAKDEFITKINKDFARYKDSGIEEIKELLIESIKTLVSIKKK